MNKNSTSWQCLSILSNNMTTSVTYPYHQIFWQCVWHVNIIKYSDNVCDISISSNILTMSATYLYHPIFWQCLWHTRVFNSSDKVCIISQVCYIYPICNCQNPNPTSRFFASPLRQYRKTGLTTKKRQPKFTCYPNGEAKNQPWTAEICVHHASSEQSACIEPSIPPQWWGKE